MFKHLPVKKNQSWKSYIHIFQVCIMFVLWFPHTLFSKDTTTQSPPPLSLQKETNRLVIFGGDHNYPPYEYLNSQGRPEGFNIDILDAVAKAMGITYTIHLGIWNDMIHDLEYEEIDALMGMYNTPERRKRFDFSVPHFIVSYAVFVRKESKIESIDDIQNKNIILQLGDLGHDYVVENKISNQLLLKKDWNETIHSLANGEGDCAIISRLQGIQYIARSGIKNLKAVGPPIIQRKYCMAVKSGNHALLAKLNEGLSIIKETGEYDKIYNKWFSVYDEKTIHIADVAKKYSWAIMALLSAIAFVLLWSWILKKQVQQRTHDLNNELKERTRVEKELIEAKLKAEESDRLKTAFLQNMSHEIRTPMNAIIGFSELLPESFNDKDTLTQYAGIIVSRSNDLLDIINDILDIAKIESGQLQLHKEECRIDFILQEIYQALVQQRKFLNKEHIQIELTHFDGYKGLIMYTDCTKLKQTLINLGNNALRYTNEGKIELGYTLKNHETIEFYVSDSGIGIPEDKIETIFNRFVQLNHGKGGTGLGLSIVKGIVSALEGQINVNSSPGIGTTFCISFPNAPIKIPIQKNSVDVQNQLYNFRGKTILLVEDEPNNAIFVKKILTETGASVIHKEYGKQAIDYAVTHEVDVILMDILLPDINGYEVTMQIKSKKPQSAIIAQTALTSPTEHLKAQEAGCCEYIAKPIRREHLLSLIKKHL